MAIANKDAQSDRLIILSPTGQIVEWNFATRQWENVELPSCTDTECWCWESDGPDTCTVLGHSHG